MLNRDSYVTRFMDMLSLRDLAKSTVNNYTSYLNQYLDFIDTSLGGKQPEEVSWEEVSHTVECICERNIQWQRECRYLLSRYAYRTAISNGRILSVTADGVTISYKDYNDGRIKPLFLSGEELIHRFLLHILPKGFSRIRYGGYLSNAVHRKNLKLIRRITGTKQRVNHMAGMKIRDRLKAVFGIDICQCPACSAEMYLVRHPVPYPLC